MWLNLFGAEKDQVLRIAEDIETTFIIRKVKKDFKMNLMSLISSSQLDRRNFLLKLFYHRNKESY
jgi:hypothetical protein